MASQQGMEPLVIADVAQLRAFVATPVFASTRPVVLDLPGMSSSEAFVAGERLNRDRAECGCSLGATAMSAGFAVALAILVLRYGLFTVASLARFPIAVAAAVGFAALGKIAGIALGRRRARREVMRIIEIVNPRS